ncbi:isocitrate lyase/phosphoenolpyruvate mutase family protein [Kineosporia rhizophila]|uniref:isocitrate lyase/PEP mutase family protein n=1 Tax=Kineosporia rhizophila TaxID=84633 RepID=UPI001E304D92|nr:isocitrate lyase/phosphoenolpyruvate mutase family protein [Kineosporia rhizophila]MCE0536541.1 isocitrate lyase/phosphoenolpyruvate mutase family protein [Kineosporia rhizophila]
MRTVPSEVLDDPRFTVPSASAAQGVGWLRAHSPRFTDGAAHRRPQTAVAQVLNTLGPLPNAPSPTHSLLRALGLPDRWETEVRTVAAAWQPHSPQSAEADAAADQLVDVCGGRTEVGAATACLLVQAHIPTAELARNPESAPVPFTRRVGPDGDEVLVDLTDAWFGRGPHACPGEHLARALAATSVPAFAALHRPGQPFVLPNAWDVASAVLLAQAGFAAVGTTSLGIAAAHGLPDATRAGREHTLSLARQITTLGLTMLTVDLEDGFTDDPAELADLAAELAGLGVRGINLEDATAGELVDPRHHAAKIAAVKATAPDLFVNARTDTFWLGMERSSTTARLQAYQDAGADGVFVPGPLTDGDIAALVKGQPLNVLASPRHTRTRLAELGVARISTGSLLYRQALSAALDTARDLAQDRPAPDVAIGYGQVADVMSIQPGG